MSTFSTPSVIGVLLAALTLSTACAAPAEPELGSDVGALQSGTESSAVAAGEVFSLRLGAVRSQLARVLYHHYTSREIDEDANGESPSFPQSWRLSDGEDDRAFANGRIVRADAPGVARCEVEISASRIPAVPDRIRFRFARAGGPDASGTADDGAKWTLHCTPARDGRPLTRGDVRMIFGDLIDE